MPDDDRHSGVLWPLAKESGDDFVESRDPAGYALDEKGRYMFDLFDSRFGSSTAPAPIMDIERESVDAEDESQRSNVSEVTIGPVPVTDQHEAT